MESLNTTIEELRIKLSDAERNLANIHNKDDILERENSELKETLDGVQAELNRLRAELNTVKKDAEIVSYFLLNILIAGKLFLMKWRSGPHNPLL